MVDDVPLYHVLRTLTHKAPTTPPGAGNLDKSADRFEGDPVAESG